MMNYYIGLDWSQKNMAFARLTDASASKVQVVELPSNLKEFKLYLDQLRGKKFLTIEESDTSQWLYTELKDHVDDLIVCDPYRNRLLSEGAKTDKIDAIKLAQLLKAGLLKPVFHSGDLFISFRKLISGYDDLVFAGVRLKNQRSALFRAQGLSSNLTRLPDTQSQFVLEGIDRAILQYEIEKKRYEKEFIRLVNSNETIRLLESIPGIGSIQAVKLAAIIVDPKRFPNLGCFLSYCGLIRLDKMSGGRSYGQRIPRYSRKMKCITKVAAMAVLSSTNERAAPLRKYHQYLIEVKRLPAHHARHALARKIASTILGVLKTKKPYDPKGVNPKKQPLPA